MIKLRTKVLAALLVGIFLTSPSVSTIAVAGEAENNVSNNRLIPAPYHYSAHHRIWVPGHYVKQRIWIPAHYTRHGQLVYGHYRYNTIWVTGHYIYR